MPAKRKIAAKEPPKKSFRTRLRRMRKLIRNPKVLVRPSSPKSS